MVNLPFASEEIIGGEIREFFIDRDDEEYVWHQDHEQREVEILEGEGWRFQYENCLPYLLEPGMIFDIPKGEYHRLIKGTKDLNFKIYKTNFDDKSNMKNTIYETFKVFLENDFFLIDNKKNNKK